MTKQEAADFLGISIRQLERHTKDNRIGVRYEKGRTKPTPFYDDAELARFKADQERPVYRPVVEPMNTTNGNTATQSDTVSNALSLVSQSPQMEVFARLFSGMAEAASAPKTAAKPMPDLGPKLLYTLPECQQLTGLSRAVLRTAIDAEELPARQIGRAWRVKRADLEQWVNSL